MSGRCYVCQREIAANHKYCEECLDEAAASIAEEVNHDWWLRCLFRGWA